MNNNTNKIGICNYDNNKKEELKKHSIYILNDDTDTDFDFYVLVDSEEAREKNEFLKELFNFLDNGSSTEYKDFVDQRHKEELEKWLGNKDDNGSNLTPLNWLKIAIEKYPYRLFVAVDDDKVDEYKKKAEKSEFLKKRICWIGKKELKKLIENKKGDDKSRDENKTNVENLKKEEEFKLYLYCEWLKHLSLNVVSKKIENIDFQKMSDGSMYHKSLTLPPIFNLSNSQQPTKKEIPISCKIDDNLEGYDFAFAHHEVPKGQKFWHSEALSGSQFSYPLMMDFYNKATTNKEDYRFLYFQYMIVESCLLRFLIIDERMYEFFKDKKNKFSSIGIESDLKIPNDNKPNLHGLIIHQGIIDKEKFTNEEFIDLKDKYPFFIITSGRGKPPNLSPLGKFLPFSVIETYLIKDYPEKILFNLSIMKLQQRR